MKKLKYYVYYSYKDKFYHLFDRINFIDETFYSFHHLYRFIEQSNIPYESLRLKSMTLKEFFNDWAYFDDKGSDKI